jgi:hypothetical protein
MGKKSGSGSVMNNPNHISESLETIFWVKILKFFDADPGTRMEEIRILDLGWKKFGSGIRDKHPGSATLPVGCTRVYPDSYLDYGSRT